MFGFNGHTQSKMEWDAAGVDIGTTRQMIFGLGAFETDRVHAIVNFDANNEGAPTTYAGFSPDFPIVNIPIGNNIILGNDKYVKFQIIALNSILPAPYIIGDYSTDAPLSPINRKQSHIINRPEEIEVIGFQQYSNNIAKTAASNVATGEINIDWKQFSNAKTFKINESYISGITKNFPESLEVMVFRECNVLEFIPKLPKNVEILHIYELPSGDFINNINTKIEDLTKLKNLNFVIPAPYGTTLANGTTTLSGNLDLSFTNQLEELIIYNNLNLESITLDPSLTGMTIFHAERTGITGSTTFDNILTNNPNLNAYNISENRIDLGVISTWTRDLNNSDIKNNMVYFHINRGNIFGDISFTDIKSNMRELYIGDTLKTNSQSNTHPIVNITGLTEVELLYMNGCSIDDLELPISTSCKQLHLYDNNLDIVTNPNLLTQINGMTGLTDLYFAVSQTSTAASKGQDSVNGLGTNPNLSSLVNLDTLIIGNCKIIGTLTLPSSTNKIISLSLHGNTGLTSIGNFENHNTISGIRGLDCDSLNIDLSTQTSYYGITLSKCVNTIIDISNRTITNQFNSTGGIGFYDMPNLTTIILPPATANFTFFGQSFNVIDNPQLTGITNIDKIGITKNIKFKVYNNNNLNIEFPFNTTFYPYYMLINNNGLDVTNVDATINNIYVNRTLYVLAVTKLLNISGTNAAPSGIFQAPSGFSLGVSDGTPVSAKEEIYVLVNNYDWIITYS